VSVDQHHRGPDWWWSLTVIENFIHSFVFSGEIKLQSLQRRGLIEIFGNFIKSDKETLFHSS